MYYAFIILPTFLHNIHKRSSLSICRVSPYYSVSSVHWFNNDSCACGSRLHRLMLHHLQLVSRLMVVDIDECAPGGIASSCNETVGGVCVGHLPNKTFLCTCQSGYALVANGTACEGLYE